MASFQMRQRDPLLDQNTQAMLERRGRELIGIGLIALALLFAVMLGSYSSEDPGWMVSTQEPAQNMLGRFGAAVSSTLVILIGRGAWAIPVILSAWGLRFILNRGIDRVLRRLAFAVIAIAVASAYASTLAVPHHWTHGFGLGGLFGDTVAGALIRAVPGSLSFGLKLLSVVTFFGLIAITLFVTAFDRDELRHVGRSLMMGTLLLYSALMQRMGQGAVGALERGRALAERRRAAQAAQTAQDEWSQPDAPMPLAKAPAAGLVRRGVAVPAAEEPVYEPEPGFAPEPLGSDMGWNAPSSLRAEPRRFEAPVELPREKLGFLARMRRVVDPDPELVEQRPPMAAELLDQPSEDRIKARISDVIRARGTAPPPADQPETLTQIQAAIARRTSVEGGRDMGRDGGRMEPPVKRPRGPQPLIVDTSPRPAPVPVFSAHPRHSSGALADSYYAQQPELDMDYPAEEQIEIFEDIEDFELKSAGYAADSAYDQPRYGADPYSAAAYEPAAFADAGSDAHPSAPYATGYAAPYASAPAPSPRPANMFRAEETDWVDDQDDEWAHEDAMEFEAAQAPRHAAPMMAPPMMAPPMVAERRPSAQSYQAAPAAVAPAAYPPVMAQPAVRPIVQPVQHQPVAAQALRAKPSPAPSPASLRYEEPAQDYELPPLALLSAPGASKGDQLSDDALEENARMLESVLDDYGVKGEIVSVRPGPVVTMYELEPAPGLKASRVIGLADDIARSMSALSARVSTVPGRSVIGIELPNTHREKVFLREIIASREFSDGQQRLPLALGKDIGGESVVANLAKMPHLLIAGTTGSGKSVAINTMILSLLYKLTPEECRLIMIDPKMLELSVYDGIPHLLSPVVTDPKKAVVALKWVVGEMEERYRKMSRMGVRNIEGYNGRVREALSKGEMFRRTIQTGFDEETGDPVFETEEFAPEAFPYIVVIVDEMADLMMVAGKEIEACIQRLAQMARASGIHLIMATQRPSVDVITGTIKANFPTRISFQVTSKIDSRTILGEMGAEQLLGQGDMLYMGNGQRISRIHGPFVSDEEVEEIVNHLKSFGPPSYMSGVVEGPDDDRADDIDQVLGLGGNSDGEDALYDQAVAIVARDRKCSTSYIQRKLGIGYNKAARLVEQMEDEGVVTAANHVGKREILIPEN